MAPREWSARSWARTSENVILHCDDARTLYEIEVVGGASKVFDLERLEVEGLPVNLSSAVRQEREAG